MTKYIYKELKSGLSVSIGTFLGHQAEQYLKAEEYNSLNRDWEYLHECLDVFENLSAEESPDYYFEATVNLGSAIERLKQSSNMNSPVPSEDKRVTGLHNYNNTKRLLMYKAWSYASSRWSDDTKKTIRIGDMCDLVWNDLLQDTDFQLAIEEKSDNDFIELLPDNSQSIRKWLKPISPAYAQKAGRKPKSRK